MFAIRGPRTWGQSLDEILITLLEAGQDISHLGCSVLRRVKLSACLLRIPLRRGPLGRSRLSLALGSVRRSPPNR